MHQPPGFEDKSKPHFFCKLKRNIYGLKQAQRQWYKALWDVLLNLDFMHLATDTSLFIYSSNNILCYYLVYVDDIIIIGNTSSFVIGIIKQISNKFSVKDMGDRYFFLCIEVFPTPKCVFISQYKYIWDLLKKIQWMEQKKYKHPYRQANISL